MKLNMRFEDSSQDFSVRFGEDEKKMRVSFGEVQTLHGKDGEDGATFIPDVSADGVISWTNDKNLPNPEPVNIMGKEGHTPVKGIDYFTPADKMELVDSVIKEIPATLFTTDETLTLQGGVLSVNTAHEPEPDNTLPITSAAVAATVGNINALLQTI